jgi:hypothetical protein
MLVIFVLGHDRLLNTLEEGRPVWSPTNDGHFCCHSCFVVGMAIFLDGLVFGK